MSTILEIPTLRTPRLLLRAFAAGDWDDMAAMHADIAVMEWLGGATRTRHEVWALMERHVGQWGLLGYGMFAVEVDGRFAGRVGLLHPAEWPEAELAWGLIPSFWGRGLATEAAIAVRDWAFSHYDWPRLVSFILPANTRSRRVAEKLGAGLDGTIELRGFVADRWVHRRGNSGGR